MARLPRLYVPNIPQLAQARFAKPLALPSDPTPVAQLDMLAAWLREVALEQTLEQRAAVHAWVLLNDRLVLLATPAAPDSIARLIQAFGRRYATRLQHGRVFTGRYHSALLQPGHWVLPAQVWLEHLPVQTGYVDTPQAWPWSSAAYHAGTSHSTGAWLTNHPDYWLDGNTPFERQARYSQRLAHKLPASQRQQIEHALSGQWALGEPAFLTGLQGRASRRLAPAPRGRPRKIRPEPPAGNG